MEWEMGAVANVGAGLIDSPNLVEHIAVVIPRAKINSSVGDNA